MILLDNDGFILIRHQCTSNGRIQLSAMIFAKVIFFLPEMKVDVIFLQIAQSTKTNVIDPFIISIKYDVTLYLIIDLLHSLLETFESHQVSPMTKMVILFASKACFANSINLMPITRKPNIGLNPADDHVGYQQLMSSSTQLCSLDQKQEP